MAKPVLVVVDDDDVSLRALTDELAVRYGSQYEIAPSRSAEKALAVLDGFRTEGVGVPLVLADQWMPAMTGIEFLSRVRELHPTARRGLLISWGDRSTAAPILEGTTLGQLEFYMVKPTRSPDEQFHRAVTEALEEWWRQRGGRFDVVTVVAEDTSARGHEIRDLLARNSVPFGFHRSDSPEGRAVLERVGVATPAVPVVALYDGSVLVDPSNAEIAAALGADIRPSGQTYDVLIVGAGPAGLAAAMYGASEGLQTAVLEQEAFGGQAGTSSLIRNYLGFPHGVSGAELAWRAYEEAWLFGTRFVYGNPATSLEESGDIRVVGLEDGTKIRCRTVIIATGMAYRRLGVPELEALVGAGVFYGAASVEAPAVAGKRVLVVGGGNSAGQAALHLSRYAQTVTILVRSQSLAASMSDYLIREIDSAPTVDVRFGVEVMGGGGEGRLEHVQLRDRGSGLVETVQAAGLFVLIGAEPRTGWLPHAVHCDQWGFVITGPDLGAQGTRRRPPLMLETSLAGVFAVGDVRHGSVKRVASAVGEGSICIRLVHDYLAAAQMGEQAR